MPSIQKAVIAREVSLALGELHGVDENVTIVHKDLKPSNVFVMKDGSVKMGDFNLSELLRWNVTAGRQCIFRRRINNAVSVSFYHYQDKYDAKKILVSITRGGT